MITRQVASLALGVVVGAAAFTVTPVLADDAPAERPVECADPAPAPPEVDPCSAAFTGERTRNVRLQGDLDAMSTRYANAAAARIMARSKVRHQKIVIKHLRHRIRHLQHQHR